MADSNLKLQEFVKSSYRRAIEGDADAQCDFAVLLLNGNGVERNVQKAIDFFKLSASQGNSLALLNLGLLYLNGKHVPRNPAEAVKWLEPAANRGNVLSCVYLAACYANGDGITQDYQKAVKYWKYAAEKGDAHSQAIIGQNLVTGAYGTPKNEAEGANWILKAAKQGHAQAENMLGVLYINGIGLNKNLDEAEKWLKSAQRHGNKTAEQNLANLEKERSMANNSTQDQTHTDTKLEQTMKYCEKARKMITLNESELALSSARNALESLVKQICSQASLDFDTRELTLEKMIDQLRNSGIVTDSEAGLMHTIRKECNKGSHIDIDGREVAVDDAKAVVSDLEKLIKGDAVARMLSGAARASSENNRPMENPDYYSEKRRYWGKWAHCLTRNELAVIPEYIELEERAKKGDVEACLDIASGFLPFGRNRTNGINWVYGDMIGMPKDLMYKGERCGYADFFLDARYYWWTMIATICAGRAALEKRAFPLKYIATAIWDAVVYSYEHVYWRDSDFLPNNTPGVPEKVAQEMCCEILASMKIDPSGFIPSFTSRRETRAAIVFVNGERFIKDYGNEKIVAPVHSDARSIVSAKLIYLTALILAEINSFQEETGSTLRYFPGELVLYLRGVTHEYMKVYKNTIGFCDIVNESEPLTFEHLEFFLDDPFFVKYMNKSKERVGREVEKTRRMSGETENTNIQQENEGIKNKGKKGLFSRLLDI